MRPLLDRDHAKLSAVLEQLLAEDVDVTAREVARRHPTLKNVTAFTRNVERAAMIKQAKRRQDEVRAVALAPHRSQVASITSQLERKAAEVVELQAQVSALVTSHVACVRAVLRHGGMPALERFWSDYKSIGDSVRAARAVPASAEVIAMPSRSRPPPRRR